MDEDNREIRDFYLFPSLDRLSQRLRLAEANPVLLDAYRFENLNFFYDLVERVPVEDAA